MPISPPSGTVNTMAASAADEIGAVRARPNTTETMMPIGTGCIAVADSRKRCSAAMPALIGAAVRSVTSPPATMTTVGTTMMSTFVRPATRPPSSAPTTAARYAPTGPAI